MVCVFKHLYCSAQLSMSNMEKRYRNKIIIIIIIICVYYVCIYVCIYVFIYLFLRVCVSRSLFAFFYLPVLSVAIHKTSLYWHLSKDHCSICVSGQSCIMSHRTLIMLQMTRPLRVFIFLFCFVLFRSSVYLSGCLYVWLSVCVHYACTDVCIYVFIYL